MLNAANLQKMHIFTCIVSFNLFILKEKGILRVYLHTKYSETEKCPNIIENRTTILRKWAHYVKELDFMANTPMKADYISRGLKLKLPGGALKAVLENR